MNKAKIQPGGTGKDREQFVRQECHGTCKHGKQTPFAVIGIGQVQHKCLFPCHKIPELAYPANHRRDAPIMRNPAPHPSTDAMVQMSANCHQRLRFASTIGINITSGGMGKNELSIKAIKPRCLIRMAAYLPGETSNHIRARIMKYTAW